MYTVTKGTLGAYECYTLADTDAGTTAVIVPEKGGMAVSLTKGARSSAGCATRTSSSRSARAAACPSASPCAAPRRTRATSFLGARYP